MKYLLLTATLIACINASAAELPKPKFEQYYTDSFGNRVETETALIKSVQGETMYHCQVVEAKVSKSGSSIAMKNVKKPKVIK